LNVVQLYGDRGNFKFVGVHVKKIGKLIIAIGIVVLGLAIGLVIYPIVYKETIKDYTRNYVVEQGYSIQSIKNIDVWHSYSAKILGYNEWRIYVELKKEPNMFFWFTYRDGNIIYQGLSSEPMMDKSMVIQYSDKFKDGTLLD